MTASDDWRSRLRSWLQSDEPLLWLTRSVGDLTGELKQAGLSPLLIDLGGVEDKAALMNVLREKLALDDWFGANWDALNDALYGPAASDTPEKVLIIQRPDDGPRLPDTDFDILTQIISDVARSECSTLRGAVIVG